MTMTQWKSEILLAHPLIEAWPCEQWPVVARFNGWLPLPPVVTKTCRQGYFPPRDVCLHQNACSKCVNYIYK